MLPETFFLKLIFLIFISSSSVKLAFAVLITYQREGSVCGSWGPNESWIWVGGVKCERVSNWWGVFHVMSSSLGESLMDQSGETWPILRTWHINNVRRFINWNFSLSAQHSTTIFQTVFKVINFNSRRKVLSEMQICLQSKNYNYYLKTQEKTSKLWRSWKREQKKHGGEKKSIKTS